MRECEIFLHTVLYSGYYKIKSVIPTDFFILGSLIFQNILRLYWKHKYSAFQLLNRKQSLLHDMYISPWHFFFLKGWLGQELHDKLDTTWNIPFDKCTQKHILWDYVLGPPTVFLTFPHHTVTDLTWAADSSFRGYDAKTWEEPFALNSHFHLVCNARHSSQNFEMST